LVLAIACPPFTPRIHVQEARSPIWGYREVEAPLRGGAWGKVVRSLGRHFLESLMLVSWTELALMRMS
jgi:hypothetical protein